MDDPGKSWYFPAMMTVQQKIPSWQLYGEDSPFPDLLHIERIVDRAAGLDWRIAPHRHLHLHQVFLILSGQIRLTINGATTEVFPPVVMNIPRGAVHGFAFSAGTEGFVLTLPALDLPEVFGANAETAAVLEHPFVAVASEPVGQAFAAISALHSAHERFRRLRLRAAAVGICCAVADACEAVAATPDNADPRIARFEALIRSQLASGWDLSDYARALALSDRHLRRLCLEATGLSAHAFLDAVRLREACCLLAYTRMRVQEVGFALGFDDPTYFTRTFRRGMGMSPGAYRAKLEQ